jgi:hypothetical protein
MRNKILAGFGLLLLTTAIASPVFAYRASGRTCQMPGTPPAPGLEKCILRAGSGNAIDRAFSEEEVDLPFSQKGDRTEDELVYWQEINGTKEWDSSGRTDKPNGDDPDMDDREDVPPSVGSGTR